MTSADRLIEVFNEANALPAGADRERYLDFECRGDPDLKEQVLSLLLADERPGDFLRKAVLSPAALAWEQPGDRIGHYMLMEKIGEGGCGVVYMAEQEEPVRRCVALKIIKLGMDTRQVVARFEAERQALALMDHPNIAKVFDAGATGTGRPFFVMELVRGITITDYCNRNQLPTGERLGLFIQVCQAVQHAHQKGVIHRDIKPSNILVTEHEAPAVPKVIDFGIAKATTGQQLTDKTLFTAFEQFVGTPAYMSPEQAMMTSMDIDTRTDIYSLGVLLYELLTGQPPFDGKELLAAGLDEMRRIIRETEPAKPSTRLTEIQKHGIPASAGSDKPPEGGTPNTHSTPVTRPSSLSSDLDWIVMKCLEKDRTRRYETASGLAADVKRHLRNEPVTAASPSVLYKFRKFARRNKLVFAAAASVAGALVIGTTVATWQAIHAHRSALIANDKTREAIAARNDALEARTKEKQQRELAEASERRTRDLKYVSDIVVAQNALRDLDTKLGMEMLQNYVPKPDEPDLRGWEWRYLRGQFPQERKMVRTPAAPNELAVSVGGRLLAVSGSGDTGVSILSLPDLEFRQRLRFPQAVGWVSGMFFNSDDSQLVVECYGKAGILKFDLQTGESSAVAPDGFENGRVTRISRDGRYLVAMYDRGKREHELRCIDASSGRTLATSGAFTVPNGYMIDHEFRLSPDGSMASVSVAGGQVKIFSIPDLNPVGAIATPGNVNTVAWSPDGRWMVTGYDYPSANDLWELATGTHRGRLESPQIGQTEDVWFSPDGSLIAVCARPNTIVICSREDLKCIRAYGADQEGETRTAVFLHDNATLASAGDPGSVKLWDAILPAKSDFAAMSETRSLWHLRFSRDGGRLAAAEPDGAVHLFDARSGKLMSSLRPSRDVRGPPPTFPWQPQVAFTSDGSTLVAGNGDQTATVYDLEARKPRFHLNGHSHPLVNVRISADDRYIATSAEGNAMILWDTSSGSKVRQINGPCYIDFHPVAGSTMIATGNRHSFGLINIDGKEQRKVSIKDDLWSVNFSPDGAMLAVGMTSALRLYRVPDLELLDTITVPSAPISIVAFHPDGQTVAVPVAGAIHLWSARLKRNVFRMPIPSDWTIGAQFSPDGNTLAVSTRGTGSHLFRAPAFSEIENR